MAAPSSICRLALCLPFKSAISMAADYIETDVQLIEDGILICFHDLSLERSTNVEQVFSNRFTEISIDGAA